MYTLLYLKWMTNKNQLHSTWNSAQCYVPSWMGTGFGREWIHVCMTESLHCLPETVTTLLIGYSVQFSSVAQSCLTLCDSMDCSMPGFPVLHHLLELAQIHVHGGNDAIQPSHPLSSSSPPALSLSQHQGLFQ